MFGFSRTPIYPLSAVAPNIVSRLANALNAQLIVAEARQAERSVHPTALDLYFQGMAHWNKCWTSAHMAKARSFFARALELDPNHVEALVGIGAVDMASAGLFLVDDPNVRLAAAEAALIRALGLAPQHALAHLFLGNVQLCSSRVAQGIAECEHALALNRNLAEAHACVGSAKTLAGRAAETEAHIQEALRLSPYDEGIHRWMSWVGIAKLHVGADDEAAAWLRQCLKANPNYPIALFYLAAALALLGKLDEARAAAKAGLALDPTFTIGRFKAYPYSSAPSFHAGGRRIVRGMRLTAVPEG